MACSEMPATICLEEQQRQSSKPLRSYLCVCPEFKRRSKYVKSTFHIHNPPTNICSFCIFKEGRWKDTEVSSKKKGKKNEKESLTPSQKGVSPGFYIQTNLLSLLQKPSSSIQTSQLARSKILEYISSSSQSSHRLFLHNIFLKDCKPLQDLDTSMMPTQNIKLIKHKAPHLKQEFCNALLLT